jgi:hypothetical protein
MKISVAIKIMKNVALILHGVARRANITKTLVDEEGNYASASSTHAVYVKYKLGYKYFTSFMISHENYTVEWLKGKGIVKFAANFRVILK